MKPIRLLAVTFLIILGIARSSVFAYDGIIDPATVALHERVQFTANPPANNHEVAVRMAVDGSGNYFTLWRIQPNFDPNIPRPAQAVIRKFNANGSLAWGRQRSITLSGDTEPVYTENWGAGDPDRTIDNEDGQASAAAGRIVATPDGGVVAALDMQIVRGTPGNQYLDELHRTLFVKFSADGNLVWRTITPSVGDLPAYVQDLQVDVAGDVVALCYTGTPYDPGTPTTPPVNHETLVRKVNGTNGALVFDGEYGGEDNFPITDSQALALGIDGQKRIYVLSSQASDVHQPNDLSLAKYVVRRLPADGNGVERTELDIFGEGFSQGVSVIAVDPSGAFYLGGSYSGAADTVNAGNRGVVFKFDANLVQQWRTLGPVPKKYFSDQPGAVISGVHVGTQGVTTVGYTRSSGTAGNQNKEFGETMRFDTNGNLVWHRYLEAQVTSNNSGSQMTFNDSRIDAAGNVYVIGYQTVSDSGSVGPFFTKYASDGALQFVKFLPVTDSQRSLLLAANGAPTVLADIFVTDNTSTIIDFDNPTVQPEPTVTVTLTSPAEGSIFSGQLSSVNVAATVNVSGPGAHIDTVFFYLDGEVYAGVSSTPYEVTIDFFDDDGPHVVVAKAVVHNSSEVSSTPVHFTTGVTVGTSTNLTVNLVGPPDSGKVTPGFLGTTARHVGDQLVITAFPKPGYIFTGWSGGATSGNPTLHFTVQPDMTLNANFAVSPFLTVNGTYIGLGDTENVSALGGALFSVTVNSDGTFSAKVTVGKLVFPFKGRFEEDGTFDRTLTILGKTVDVSLQLDVLNDTDSVTGTITVAGVTYDLSGNRNVFNKFNPAPQAGLYTFVVPSPGGAGVPTGDSWFTATVKTNGKVEINGALPDGSPIKRSGALGADGSFALYASLYKGKGVFASDLTFVFPRSSDANDSDVTGAALWQKPARGGNSAFEVQGNLLGSFFVKPDETHTVFGGAASNVLVHFATTPTIADVTASLATSGKATSSTAGFLFKAKDKSGTFIGNAPKPSVGALFHGVILQKQQIGRGYVAGAATGALTVTVQP